MKLDSELTHGHSTLSRGLDSQHFENNDNAAETRELKADNEIMREDKMGIMFNPKINKWQMDTDTLQTEEQNGDRVRNIPGLHDLVNIENSINGKENMSVDYCTRYTVPASNIKWSEEESEFYTDLSVTNYELPELIVCFREGDYHVVKDICVDDGLPSLDKILEENGDMPNEGLFGFLDSDFSVINNYLAKEKVNAAAPNSNVMNPFVECDREMGVANQCDSENLIEKGEGDVDATDEVVNVVSEEDTMPKNLLVQESWMDNSHPEPSNLDGNEGHHQSGQGTSMEAISANSMVPPTAGESNICNQANEAPFNCKVESGSITFNFDATLPATSGIEEDTPNTDFQQPYQTLNMLSIEEGEVDSRTASSRSFFIQHGHGESSFSTVEPLSDQIAYSGPIAYSGSISLRSDSSTTSTRSFAFPILHSEWNGSPIKMAKADRRHFRKHRGWSSSFLCCRF